MSGKSKYETAKELGVSHKTVYRLAKDLPSKPCGWPGIRGKTLEILQELVLKGYHICSHEGSNKRFFQLKKTFPTLYRAKMNRMSIFYLAGREDDVAKAFLGVIGKKIISYQELKQVTDVFHADLSKQEKGAFLFKKRRNGRVKNQGVQKEDSLPLDSDSFSFFYIRKYCTTSTPESRIERLQKWTKLAFIVILIMVIRSKIMILQGKNTVKN